MKPTRVKLQLLLLGVKQIEIASQAKVRTPYINRVINGKQKPSRKVVEAICEITGLTEGQLFEEEAK